MNAFHYVIVSIILLAALGCGMEGPAPSDSKPATEAQTAQPPAYNTATADHKHADPVAAKPASSAQEAMPPVVAAEPKPTAAEPKSTGTVAAEPKPSAAAASETKPGETRVKAEVGMGMKGHDYGGGLIAVVAASLWRTKERVALDMIVHNMDLYKADHDGKGPKTHDEFMQKIIKEGDIKLPELPPGQSYRYDPDTEQLMILKPADPNGP